MNNTLDNNLRFNQNEIEKKELKKDSFKRNSYHDILKNDKIVENYLKFNFNFIFKNLFSFKTLIETFNDYKKFKNIKIYTVYGYTKLDTLHKINDYKTSLEKFFLTLDKDIDVLKKQNIKLNNEISNEKQKLNDEINKQSKRINDIQSDINRLENEKNIFDKQHKEYEILQNLLNNKLFELTKLFVSTETITKMNIHKIYIEKLLENVNKTLEEITKVTSKKTKLINKSFIKTDFSKLKKIERNSTKSNLYLNNLSSNNDTINNDYLMSYYLYFLILGDDTKPITSINSNSINESTISNANIDLYNAQFDNTINTFDSTIKEITTSSSNSSSFDSYSSSSNHSSNSSYSNESHSSSSFDSYGSDSSGSGSGSGCSGSGSGGD